MCALLFCHFCSQLVLKLFLNFEQFGPRCSYKVVLIKKRVLGSGLKFQGYFSDLFFYLLLKTQRFIDIALLLLLLSLI